MSRRCDREPGVPRQPRPLPQERWEWDPLTPRLLWAEWRDDDGSTPLPGAVVFNRGRVADHLRDAARLP